MCRIVATVQACATSLRSPFLVRLNSDERGKEESFSVKDLISRFRANIITKGARAFEEEQWDEISIGSLHFQVSFRSGWLSSKAASDCCSQLQN